METHSCQASQTENVIRMFLIVMRKKLQRHRHFRAQHFRHIQIRYRDKPEIFRFQFLNPQPQPPLMSNFHTIDPPPPSSPPHSSPPSTMSNQNAPPGPPPGAILTRGRTAPARSNAVSRSNLKPYHWLKLPGPIQGSPCDEVSRAPGIDMAELERLFSVASPRTKCKVKPIVERVQLIDLRRAYNCEIMLSKVTVPVSELVNLVLVMDDSRLDLAQVDDLIKFCPTKEEMEKLQKYTGDVDRLGKCEQFFLELMQVPRMEAKLRVFSYKTKFTAIASDLRNSLTIANSAADEIKNSTKLKMVMATILSLGIALNPGTGRGSAVGFRLDSLHKLTKTRNINMTLMHYLCKVIAEKLPEILDFPKDLVSLEAAAKIELEVLADDMQAITKGMERAEMEWTSSHNDGSASAEFCKVLQVFLGYAEAEVKSLTSLYSVVGKNAKALPLYFGEDPTRWPFKQVLSTLLSFARDFTLAHEENVKQIELDKRKAETEAASSQVMIESNKKQSTESPSAHGQ